MRRVASIILAATLLLALATPAAADATPVDERRQRSPIPLEDTLITIEAEIGCGTFDVLVEDISGKVTYVFITEDRHGNLLERVIYRTVTRYTNLSSGASFVEYGADGSSVSTVLEYAGEVIDVCAALS